MKRLFSVILIVSIVAAFILIYSFGYSISLALYHLLSISILCLTVALSLESIRLLLKPRPVTLLLANGIALIFWLFIFLFYTAILGSNYFWGNTITFDILWKYLKSFDSIISILPVEKWLIIFVLIVYTLIVISGFYLVRLNKNWLTKNTAYVKKNSKLILAVILILAFIFVGTRNSLLDLKRKMHFKQEPLIYFCLGPMWDIHSDELIISQASISKADQECIKHIKPSTDNKKLAIIILLDALRSDHLPMYGYARQTTPFLDSLYRSNNLIKVRNSFSTSTNTIGGVSGLFYSKDWNNFNFGQLSLMQFFKLAGYKTSAFLTGYHSGWYGLSTMYRKYCDNFYESTSEYNSATDDDLVTLKKIESSKFETGSFIFIHLLSTHTVGKRNNEFKKFFPDKIGLQTSYKDVLTNNYDNGILQGDYVIRKIFEKLKNESLLDDATIFIVGDHGDLIGDDGQYGHAGGLHEKLLEVPILIHDAQPGWYKQTEIATLKDIAPTLADRLNNSIPNCWQGTSLHMADSTDFQTLVSSSTTKSSFSNGILTRSADTIRLEIFNDKHQKMKEAIKIDSIHWRKMF